MFAEVFLPFQWSSAIIWAMAGALPLIRGYFRSPGGWSFSLFAFSLATFALLESLLNPGLSPEQALLILRLSGTVSTLAIFSFFFFAKWIALSRRREDILLAIPAGAMVVLIWMSMTVTVDTTAWGFSAEEAFPIYVIWLSTLYLFASVSLLILWRGASKYKEDFARGYGKIMAVATSFTALLIAGLIVLILAGPQWRNLLSSILIVPGFALLLSLAPLTSESITTLVRKAAKARGEILHSFLIYHGGTLIASRSLKGHSLPDEDIFSAVLDAIQRFMNTSLPMLGTGWLDAIDYGELKILTHRGEYCFLVLVTSGREDDLLRGEMREVLRRFEERNVEVLVRWDGDAESPMGAADAVGFFFDLDKVF